MSSQLWITFLNTVDLNHWEASIWLLLSLIYTVDAVAIGLLYCIWQNSAELNYTKSGLGLTLQVMSSSLISNSLVYRTVSLCEIFRCDVILKLPAFSSDVKSSRPKWPQGQNFGLGLKDLASASKLWPRPGFYLVVVLCNWAFFRAKIV